ncbi:MAG: signal peptidase I [Candidatus Aminicenantes bacterium]|nr:signal peptidase I [Candidatus Aminicenantes bacterium]
MKLSRKSRSVKYILLNIFGAAIFSILLFIYLFSPYKVIGNSMSPIIKSGDKILISNSLIAGKIKRFDIVVFQPPGPGGKKLIKRVVGLPGEFIEIKSGDVLVNNSLLNEPFLKNRGDVIFRSVNMKLRQIPQDCYFFLGDYREKSTDSRNFGPLHRNTIIGKTLIRYWPFKKIGLIR